MSISEKVRKELWAKSGNRCAICKIELFNSISKEDFNIGEECHIISSKVSGPRHELYYDYDSYDNLILLCRNHHKEIDDCVNLKTYTKDKLRSLKKQHENWVNQQLSTEDSGFLQLIKNGRELISVLTNCTVACFKSNDELKNIEEVDFIGGVWQEIFDFIDVYYELEPSDITRMEFLFSQMIKELETKGFAIYARFVKKNIFEKFGVNDVYDTAHIHIKRIKG